MTPTASTTITTAVMIKPHGVVFWLTIERPDLFERFGGPELGRDEEATGRLGPKPVAAAFLRGPDDFPVPDRGPRLLLDEPGDVGGR